MTESFAPSVVIDGRTVEPPGWMWVLAFALGGCTWAIKECESESFKEAVRGWIRDRKRHHLRGARRHHYEREVERLAEALAQLDAQLPTDTPTEGK